MQISHQRNGRVFIELESEELTAKLKGVMIGGRKANLDVMVHRDLGTVVIVREPGTEKRVFTFLLEPSGLVTSKKPGEPKPRVLSNIWEPYQPVPPVTPMASGDGSVDVDSTPL